MRRVVSGREPRSAAIIRGEIPLAGFWRVARDGNVVRAVSICCVSAGFWLLRRLWWNASIWLSSAGRNEDILLLRVFV